MSKFKVGDRVRYIGPAKFTVKLGDVGTVDEILDDGGYSVRLSSSSPHLSTYIRADEWDLDLVGTTRATKASVGGSLTLPAGSVPLTTAGPYPAAEDVRSQAEAQRLRWKAEGRCQECGTLLPMLPQAWGLGECPHHPKPDGNQ